MTTADYDKQIRDALDAHWRASAAGGKVAHETQYFADPFEAPAWRSQWVVKMTNGIPSL
jgi:hypothetical protein